MGLNPSLYVEFDFLVPLAARVLRSMLSSIWGRLGSHVARKETPQRSTKTVIRNGVIATACVFVKDGDPIGRP